MNLIKISFTGDIMSDSEQEEALITNHKSHSVIFENATQLFSKSDLVVANLETPIAGEELGYTEKAASFAEKCKKLGFETVSMKNEFETIYGENVRKTSYLPAEETGTEGSTAPAEEAAPAATSAPAEETAPAATSAPAEQEAPQEEELKPAA